MKIQKTSFNFFLLFLTVSIILGASNAAHPINPTKMNSNIWKTIQDTTWRKDNKWAGEGYVFYQDMHGAIKCIHQIYGSGVMAVKSSFVKMTIIDKTHLKLDDNFFELKGKNILVSNNEILKLSDKEPNIYGKTEKIKMDLIRSGNFDIDNLQKQ